MVKVLDGFGVILGTSIVMACATRVSLPQPMPLQLDRASYAAGQSIVVTLQNRRSVDVSDPSRSRCGTGIALQIRDGDTQWTTVPTPATPAFVSPCYAVGYLFPPGETHTLRLVLPVTAASGTYRLFARELWISPTFEVTAAADNH